MAPQQPGRPTVSLDGCADPRPTQFGDTLTCDEGGWEGDGDIDLAYQWVDIDSDPLAGKRSRKIKLSRKDIGRVLMCAVTATNLAGSAEASSARTTAALTAASAAIRRPRSGVHCDGDACLAVFNAGGPVQSARAILTRGARTKGHSAEVIYPSSSSIAIRFKRGIKASVVFRVILRSKRTIVKKIVIG
jgi:hypothetical protein